jgi:phospholipid N-methyltransferase
MHLWKECGDFFRQCRRHFRSTGAILPSTRFLARALVSEIRKPRGPARILEVGPGTGSVTKEILRFLHPQDRVDLVEINGYFVDLLRRRFEEEPHFRIHREQCQIIHLPVEEVRGEGLYDFIVSGLPLNNFPGAQVRTIFRTYDRLLRPGGMLTYYEYVFIRQLKTPFVDRRERRRLFSVGRIMGGYIRDYQIRRERILINVPPATVRHLQLKPKSANPALQPG